MILYYAMGAGLGHLSRATAIIRACPFLQSHCRVFTSSIFVNLVRSLCPAPIDEPPRDVLFNREQYISYLKDYLWVYRVSAIILDTFPWGVTGEFKQLGLNLPKVLLARSLKHEAYLEHIGQEGPSDHKGVLTVDAITEGYQAWLAGNMAKVDDLGGPVLLETGAQEPGDLQDICLLVHAGPASEVQFLRECSGQLLERLDLKDLPCEVLTPGDGIFPAEELMDSHKVVVSAAGYGLAWRSIFRNNHYIFPMDRRLDDQEFRQRAVTSGLWPKIKMNMAPAAGNWIEGLLASCV